MAAVFRCRRPHHGAGVACPDHGVQHGVGAAPVAVGQQHRQRGLIGTHRIGDVLSGRGIILLEGVADERARPDRVGSQHHHGNSGLTLDLAVAGEDSQAAAPHGVAGTSHLVKRRQLRLEGAGVVDGGVQQRQIGVSVRQAFHGAAGRLFNGRTGVRLRRLSDSGFQHGIRVCKPGAQVNRPNGPRRAFIDP